MSKPTSDVYQGYQDIKEKLGQDKNIKTNFENNCESEDVLKLGIGPGVGMWRRYGVQAKQEFHGYCVNISIWRTAPWTQIFSLFVI